MPLIQQSKPPEFVVDLQDRSRVEELPSDDNNDDYEDVDSETDYADMNGTLSTGRTLRSSKHRPLWLQQATLGLFHEDLRTTSSEAQVKVTRECLPHLLGQDNQGLQLNSHGLPHLRRAQHISYLYAQFEKLPAPYVVMDASRPWLFYWTLCGLSTLDEDISRYRERLINTVRPLQNPTGGFGGGHGQLSHLAGSYATVLALAMVEALEVIDRKAMWQWLGTVKQADGGFCMALGAEEDIRGAYCAMTIITILNLPLELPHDAPAREAGLTLFTDGLAEWVGRCQTYEGGIGGAPSNEAHGAYAFCALACLSIIDAPQNSIPKYLDMQSLVAWLAARQTQPEGGFQGRQEKLVDACYSHWVGGCFALLQAALGNVQEGPENGIGEIWNREALVRYLLTCAQQPTKKGGMRDKPSTRPDAYHTCYSLAGLSHAQNRYTYSAKAATAKESSGRSMAAFNWSARRPDRNETSALKLGEADVVDFVHPVFVIPMAAVEAARQQFAHAKVDIDDLKR